MNTQKPKFRKPFVPTLAQQVALEIMRLRTNAGLTRQHVADLIDENVIAVHVSEQGDYLPSPHFMKKFAEAFDVRWEVRAVPKEEEADR